MRRHRKRAPRSIRTVQTAQQSEESVKIWFSIGNHVVELCPTADVPILTTAENGYERWVDDILGEHLRNSALAVRYADLALEDGDIEGFLYGLRATAIANEGINALAEKTGLGRESLYKTLSKAGNPRLRSLVEILGALGMRLSVSPIDNAEKVVAISGKDREPISLRS
jgi:probable addiction module antidote protein